MLKKKDNRSARVMVIIMALFLAIRLIFPPISIWSYDVFGYHLYLPSFIVHHDLKLKDLGWVEEMNELHGVSPSLYQIKALPDGSHAIRFSPGMSIMNLPFFLAGHMMAKMSGYPADGFSRPYQWAIFIAGIFYILAGIYFLRKALKLLFDDRATAITLFLLFIGSNLFFFASWGNPMPHIYIFTLYAFILWMTASWYLNPRTGSAIFLGLASGLAIISRPSEIFILFIPLLWGIWDGNSIRARFELLWKRKMDVILFAAFLVLAVSPQLFYWKYVTGHWIFNSYDDPQSGFNFDQPRLGYILFGFRKGLYIYSPMLLFATLGFITLFRQKRELFLPVLLFFIANIYLVSVFSSLVSYGWRVFIQAHAILAIPLAFFVDWVLKRKLNTRIWIAALLIFVILLNLFKSYQMLRKIIDGSRMTREAYFGNFFVINPKKMDKSLLLVERSESSTETMPQDQHFTSRVLKDIGFEQHDNLDPGQLDSLHACKGHYSLIMDSTHIWSPAIEVPYREITKRDYAWIRASVWVYREAEQADDELLLVVHFNYEDQPYKYRTVSSNDLPRPDSSAAWQKLSLDYMTPEVRTLDDNLKVYAWYRGKKPIFIDELKVEVFEPATRQK